MLVSRVKEHKNIRISLNIVLYSLEIFTGYSSCPLGGNNFSNSRYRSQFVFYALLKIMIQKFTKSFPLFLIK